MVVREDKRERIIENAMNIFAEKGYHKTTTAMVAKASGVTQPYVFHFFSNKEELFKVVIDRAFSRIYDTFSEVDAPSDQLIPTMGRAFFEIMQTNRDEVLMVMQAYTISDEGIREHVRKMYNKIFESLTLKMDLAEIPNPKESAADFIGTGLLITLAEVLDMPELLEAKNKTDC
ncbi:TetR/AcrR family transcriptional regulator [Pseudalkalibacillus salsuginis]|uniref:TetR/AcrR family transcriptional regulator n=1 Tax=Pseudalkalibacillus salsuginis TaxID=2910972 RepID=UPI001F38C479|nr:TetR/AcrR family transcriptional regulator [Pseudalkalibacillus salsuginis]MCF6411409.1 TetR/AcrR family transcriptional regulator [Pseudalkalibacillus salsuginis]